jgi:hypothetical protein
MPDSSASRRKERSPTASRLTWAAAIALMFVVIVAYETREALRQQQAAMLPGVGQATPVPLEARLVEYYRAHALPRGWRIGRIEPTGPATASVAIVFSPELQDSRYGQNAPAADLADGPFCPREAALWDDIPALDLQVELSDKRGIAATRRCARP